MFIHIAAEHSTVILYHSLLTHLLVVEGLLTCVIWGGWWGQGMDLLQKCCHGCSLYMSFCEQMYRFPLGYILMGGIAGHRACVCSALEDATKWSSRVVEPIYPPMSSGG